MVDFDHVLVTVFHFGGSNVHKSKRLGLVLTPAEKTAVIRLAEVEGGLSQAAVVRRLIRQAAKSRGLWPPAEARAKESHAETKEVRHA